ncbi:MAG: hypothetical protein HQM10_24085 [Candidatus Riflebacteria bacterium]|nr:hypothetical protein [Candidatus Riflebacteria bacterium]
MKSLITRINAVLILISLCLLFVLGIFWNMREKAIVQSDNNIELASELIAHGLNHDAATLLQQAVELEPQSERTLNTRKILADLYMNQIGDYEKALTELIFLKSRFNLRTQDIEDKIKNCMNRLGRVYDVQRKILLENGRNPLKSDVSSATVIKFGNESGLTIEQLEQHLAQRGLPLKSPPKDALNRMVQQLAGEMLFKRAAVRSGISKRSTFIEKIKQMEESMILQSYLEEEVLKDVKVDEQALQLYLQQHREEFDSPMRVVFSEYAFASETSAKEWLSNQNSASAPEILRDHANSTVTELPKLLQSVKWSADFPKDPLGPVETSGKWLVYLIHEFIPERKVPPELAKKQAQLRLLEEKQGSKISEAISELSRKEEFKILEDVIEKHFYPPSEKASGTPDTK